MGVILRHRGNALYLFTAPMDIPKAKSIPGGVFDKNLKCWVYPFSSLETIQKFFPSVILPETVSQFIQLKKSQELQMIKTKVQTESDWDHNLLKPEYKLLDHQKMCVKIARNNKCFAFFLGTGTGKTLTSLAIWEDRPMKTLVVCPLAIINSAWREDAEKFYGNKIHVVSLNQGHDPKKKKLLKVLNSGADIFVVNFESFKILFDTLKQMKFDRLIVDESSKMKNSESGITEDLLSFGHGLTYGRRIPERYVLSGTPAPNSPSEYWAQIELIAPKLLGHNFSAFKNYFFEVNPNDQYRLIISELRLKELMDRIKKVAVFMDKEDCNLNLLPPTMTRKEIFLPKDEMKIYKQMEHEQFALIPDSVVGFGTADLDEMDIDAMDLDTIDQALPNGKMVLAANKLAAIMKLRQITSGFILDENKIPRFVGHTKLNILKETLDEIGPNEPTIIWIQFHEEVRVIREMIEKEYGEGSVRALYGKTTALEKNIKRINEDQSVRDAVINGFKNNDFQYLIAHPRTAMYGLTFVNSAFAIYYSMSHSYEEFHQSRDRLHRLGQTRHCTYYFLVCTNTIDHVIYQAIKTKQRISEMVLDYIRIVKGGGEYGTYGQD